MSSLSQLNCDWKKTSFLSLTCELFPSFFFFQTPGRALCVCVCVCVCVCDHGVQRGCLCSSSCCLGDGRGGKVTSSLHLRQAAELTPPSLRQVRRQKQSRAHNEVDCWSQTDADPRFVSVGTLWFFEGMCKCYQLLFLIVLEVDTFSLQAITETSV